MRKFIITHPTYSGEATVTYNSAGLLCEINMQDTNMSMEERHYFKGRVASHIDNIAVKFDKDTLLVEATYEVTFETWWKDYNKKINKARCIPIWKKLNKTDQLDAWQGIKPYDAYLKRESWRKKADPETYLRNRYWENEYD